MYKIGIVSDTHGLLRPEVLKALEGCDVILHGGDINKQVILDRLQEIAPLIVVRGNNDKDWAQAIPEVFEGEVCGLRIFMSHKRSLAKDVAGEPDLVVSGHTHRYVESWENGVCYLNPGSCGPRRFNQEITMALLYVDEGENDIETDIETDIKAEKLTQVQSGRNFRIEKIVIPHPEKGVSKDGGATEAPPANIGEMIPAMVRDVDAGKTVKQIARRYKLSEELVTQIVRMYLTHPGVDVDGILRRIGL